MNEKVLIYSPLPEERVRELAEQFPVVTARPDSPEFREELSTATGLIGRGLKVDAQLLDQAPQLKVVSNISVGYDNLDVTELTRRGILATNTPDVLTETTADTIFGLLIATARRIPELDKYVKEGQWNTRLSLSSVRSRCSWEKARHYRNGENRTSHRETWALWFWNGSPLSQPLKESGGGKRAGRIILGNG